MSIRVIQPAEDALSMAYVVAAPCRSDVMTATLRSAYASDFDDTDPFADLMVVLDRIESLPRQV
jgi:hypothetical protein